MITVKQNGKNIKEVITKPLAGGAVYIEAKFVADSVNPKLCIEADQPYTYYQANLNRGSVVKDFVPNSTSETMLKALFDDINQVKLDFKSADNTLKGQILATVEGYQREYTKSLTDLQGTMTDQVNSALSQADNKITAAKSDLLEKLNVAKVDLGSQLSQTAESLKIQFTKQLKDSSGNTLSESKSYTDQKADQINRTLTAVKKSLDGKVSSTEYNKITDTVNSHSQTIGLLKQGIENQASQILQTNNLIRQQVTNLSDGITSVADQMAGYWAIKNLNASGDVLNQLNLNKDGTVKIDGKLVHITGQTMIEDAVIKSSMIDSLSANKITSGTLDANKVTVSNLDAANITGLDTSFIQSKWNAINGRVQIDGNEIKLLRYQFDKKSAHTKINHKGITTKASDGSIVTLGPDGFDVATNQTWSSHLGNEGLELRTNKGVKVGGVTALVNEVKGVNYIKPGTPDGVGLTAEKGKYVGLYRQITDRKDLYFPVITIGGSSGHIHTFGEWVAGYDSEIRMKFISTVQAGEPIFAIVNANNNNYCGIGIGMWSNLYLISQGHYYRARDKFSWMS